MLLLQHWPVVCQVVIQVLLLFQQLPFFCQYLNRNTTWFSTMNFFVSSYYNYVLGYIIVICSYYKIIILL